MKKRIVIYGGFQQGYTLAMKLKYVFEVIAFMDRSAKLPPTGAVGWNRIPLYSDLSKIGDMAFDYIFVLDPDFEGVQREFNVLHKVNKDKLICLSAGHQPGKRDLFLCLANEIHRHQIPGSVAEVGVDYGDTAKYLNLFYNDRTFYLFDTFEGFAERDIEHERTMNHVSDGVARAYNNRTNEKDVLARMYLPEKCIVKKGVFPESLGGLDDRFAFVHLDCDLTKPTMAAVEYFYPRLSPGGYICIHDYYNALFPIIRQIVRQYSMALKAAYVPVPSYDGAVICKPFV